MTRLLIFSFVIACLLFTNKTNGQADKYRRSSLSMILIESESFPNKEAVMGSWNNYPFPDKYNKHDIELKSFDIKTIVLNDEDLLKSGYLKDTLNNVIKLKAAETAYNSAMGNSITASSAEPLKYLNTEKTSAVRLPSEKQEYQLKIDKFIKTSKLANKLVEAWFNYKPGGLFEMSLIHERGLYDASVYDAELAKGTTKGSRILKDAGKQLIGNTFITFTKLEFHENEPAARILRDALKANIAIEMAGKPQMLIDKAIKGADETYEKTKEGYTLLSKTWLYKLQWNDSIYNTFVSTIWENPKSIEETDIFSIEFIGSQYNQSIVTFKIGETRTQDENIDLALVRNVDNAFAKLQKNNDVFKPYVSVLTVNPMTAQIGMKEGLEGGEKFEVSEMVFNPETSTTEYKIIGSATADKVVVWDNRYNANEKAEPVLDEQGNPLPEIKSTLFKGSSKIQPGMLLKQVK